MFWILEYLVWVYSRTSFTLHTRCYVVHCQVERYTSLAWFKLYIKAMRRIGRWVRYSEMLKLSLKMKKISMDTFKTNAKHVYNPLHERASERALGFIQIRVNRWKIQSHFPCRHKINIVYSVVSSMSLIYKTQIRYSEW